MDKLLDQVRRARRRLIFEQFLSRLGTALLITFAIALVAIAAPKLFVIEGVPSTWATAWLAGAAVCGLVVAAVWTLVDHLAEIEAAMEIDRRFDLRERVASCLSLPEADLQGAAGQALMNDALRAVDRIEVNSKFPVRVERRAWLPIVPALLAFGLMMFLDNRTASSSVDPAATKLSAEQVKNSTEQLRKKIAEQKKAADKKGLKEVTGILDKIEKGTRELDLKAGTDQKQAAVKLNDLAKQLEQRRQELGTKNELQKQLQNIKDFGQGPAEKLASAMKQGNWQQAQQELGKLKQQLEQGKLKPEDLKQLSQQVAKLEQKLKQAAESHQQATKDLKKQIDEARKNGNTEQASKLQQKLDQLAAQKPQMQKLQQMAQQMAQAQQAMQKGDAKAAAEAMDKMAEQMSQMQLESEELEMLEQALDQISQAKDSMACKSCSGQGCQMCQGGGKNPNPFGKPGQGMGEGRGSGPRPDEKNATNFRDSRVKQEVRRGALTFGGQVEGPNVKGNVAEAIKTEMESQASGPADPLTSERLPRSRRDHAEEYFGKLREGT